MEDNATTSTNQDGNNVMTTDAQTVDVPKEESALVDQGSDAMETMNCGLICWGSAEFGQNGHGLNTDVEFSQGQLDVFRHNQSMVREVACGSSHTLVITNSNEIYVWGNSSAGQLGSGLTEASSIPQTISLVTQPTHSPRIHSVSCGSRHTYVLLENGHVFNFGNNSNGQLGYDYMDKNYKEIQCNPQLLPFPSDRVVEKIACGEQHTLFLFRDHTMAAVGNNAHGQLGIGNTVEAKTPQYLADVRPVRDIAAGSHHNLVITDNGDVLVWGDGKACGKSEDILSPEKKIDSKRRVIQVAAGAAHSLALSAHGCVYSFGSGSEGQLGHGEGVTYLRLPKLLNEATSAILSRNVVQIACGDFYSAAVTGEGRLFMWGKNSHVIDSTKPPQERFLEPQHVNCGGPTVKGVTCGAWHAAAMTGTPDWQVTEDDSADVTVEEDWSEVDVDRDDVSNIGTFRSPSKPAREGTRVSLADFYAPTPDLVPGLDREPCDLEYCESPIDASAESPLPVASIGPPPSNVIFDTPRTEDSDPDRQSLSEIHVEIIRKQVSSNSPLRERIQRSHLNAVSPDLVVKVPHPTIGFQKGKTCLLNHGGHFIQVSQSTADRFTLPRENTNFTSRIVDFNLDGQSIVLKAGTAGPDMKDAYESRDPHSGSGKRESERAKLIRTLLKSDRSSHGTKSSRTSQMSNNFMLQINRSQTFVAPLDRTPKQRLTKLQMLQAHRHVSPPGRLASMYLLESDMQHPANIGARQLSPLQLSPPGRVTSAIVSPPLLSPPAYSLSNTPDLVEGISKPMLSNTWPLTPKGPQSRSSTYRDLKVTKDNIKWYKHNGRNLGYSSGIKENVLSERTILDINTNTNNNVHTLVPKHSVRHIPNVAHIPQISTSKRADHVSFQHSDNSRDNSVMNTLQISSKQVTNMGPNMLHKRELSLLTGQLPRHDMVPPGLWSLQRRAAMNAFSGVDIHQSLYGPDNTWNGPASRLPLQANRGQVYDQTNGIAQAEKNTASSNKFRKKYKNLSYKNLRNVTNKNTVVYREY